MKRFSTATYSATDSLISAYEFWTRGYGHAAERAAECAGTQPSASAGTRLKK